MPEIDDVDEYADIRDLNPSTAPATAPAFAPDTYALVEIFGRRSHAGRVSETTIAGVGFLRVETPELPAIPATERRERLVKRKWNNETDRYEVVEEHGRYVRDAVPPEAPRLYSYNPSAVFGIRLMTQEEAIDYERARQEIPGERWVPDGSDAKALPSGGTPVSLEEVLGDAFPFSRRESEEDDE